MAMYIMHGKTFIKDYIRDNKPKKVLKTQYAIVSTTIRKKGKYRNVVSAHNLFPEQRILSEYMMEGNKRQFKEDYVDQLKEHRAFLAVLVKGVIEEGYDVVFLCGNKERKLGYLKILSKFIESEFNYPVNEYGQKPSKIKVDQNISIMLADDVLRKAKKKQKKKAQKTPQGRMKILKKMKKSEMIKELKSRNLYSKGMCKEEMFETLELFYVNE